ncbi:hypothetical protein pb186bvf_002953 [Paramecium bursaria]
MEIKLYDIDINDDDTIDLAQKIENYGRDEFLFKDDDRQYKQKAPINNFKRLIDKKAFIDFKGPIQPRQVSTIFSLEISSHDSKQPEIQHRKRGRLSSAVSPQKHRFGSKKQSQFSGQYHLNQEVATKNSSPQKRRDREQSKGSQDHLMYEIPLLRKIGSREQDKRPSQSSINSPKSILKSNNSSLDISRVSSVQSRLSFQSVNLNSPDSKVRSKKSVKFVLSRKQAKRENLIF